MRIRITCEDERGSIQLNYDDSKEQAMQPGIGYGEPPCTNDALHTALDVIIADSMKINQEARSGY